MNEQQFFMATRNIVRLEDLSAETVKRILPQLRWALDDLSRMIDALPSEDLARQIQYRQMQQRIASIMAGVGDRFKAELSATLRAEVEQQVYFAEKFLRTASAIPSQREAALAPQPGLGTVPTELPSTATTATARGYTAQMGAVNPVLGPANFQLGSEITRTQLMALADDARVLGKTLDELFDSPAGSISPWLKTNIGIVDRVVKTGFLTGQTNEEIAKQLMGRERLMRSQAQAVARTAVMDMSQRAHEKFWDANRDRIAAYEYDATFDYRVCEICAPWHGAIKRKKEELPAVPQHPNCRCRVLPVTQTQWELRKEDGPQNATFIELVPGEKVVRGEDGKPLRTKGGKWKFENVNHPPAKKGERYYANPVVVNGKRYWKKAVDAKAGTPGPYQMADFLRNANNVTQQQVLGTDTKTGEDRAARFRQLLKEKDRFGNPRFTAQQALLKVLPRDLGNVRVRSRRG